MKKLISLAALTAILAGCTDLSRTSSSATYGPDAFGEEPLMAAPATESLNNAYLLAAGPKYYIGSAYQVEGVQYIPAEDMTFNQTGVAGVIPADLDGKKTSNGETFDSNQLLATSKTLPLPTIAQVTNLDNGQSVIVRINNRGPYVNTRLIDLSSAAAAQIGLKGQGKVQVQVLADQSTAVKNATLGTTVVAEPTPVATETVATTPASGPYSIQLAAFYAQDSADALANRMKVYGETAVVNEGDLFKVRIINLDAQKARSVIDALRSTEGMAPGLLKDGHWVNADSI
jgi:rare lipoprotein A